MFKVGEHCEHVCMATSKTRALRLWDAYVFPGFRPQPTVRGLFGDPKARVITLERRSTQTHCGCCGRAHMGWYDRRTRQVRDLSCGDTRIYLEIEVRRVQCRGCGTVKRERLDFLADNPFYTKRFALYVGRRCRASTVTDLAKELHLDWDTVKTLDKQYMQAQLTKAGTPRPKAIGIDEISIRKGHTYRIVVSDLMRRRPIWFGGEDRSEKSMGMFYEQLGPKKSGGIRLAVMDMWKPFRTVTNARAPQAAILFDKLHIMRHLGKALDDVRTSEYRRLSGHDRSYIKGQKYTLLSRREHLTLDGRKALKKLLAANSRLKRATYSRNPSVSSGTTRWKAGHGASSTAGGRA